MSLISLLLGMWLLYIAFAPRFRPMSKVLFAMCIGFGVANLAIAVAGFVASAALVAGG